MADLDKIYQLTIENNTNIKHIMLDHNEMKKEIDINIKDIQQLKNFGKKTAKDHLISFSKGCGAFMVIGGGVTLMAKIVGKLWQ
jgi:hypothetical protein